MTSAPNPDALNAGRVRAAFDRAAPTYDAAAEFQRLICDHLVDMLASSSAPRAIADLGCGTGYASDRLAMRYPASTVVAIDFAPAMLGVARRQARARHWIAADFRQLPLADSSMDLLCSSLALQWNDPAAMFAEARRVLRPGGDLALATLGPGTLHELADAFAGIDRNDHVLRFRDMDGLAADLGAAGLRVRHAMAQGITLFRPDMRSILRELKAIGANNAGPRRRREVLGRAAWREIERRYEHRRTPSGLPVTYAALYLIATRP